MSINIHFFYMGCFLLLHVSLLRYISKLTVILWKYCRVIHLSELHAHTHTRTHSHTHPFPFWCYTRYSSSKQTIFTFPEQVKDIYCCREMLLLCKCQAGKFHKILFFCSIYCIEASDNPTAPLSCNSFYT